MRFLISFRACANPNLSKYVTFSVLTYKAIQQVHIDLKLARFIT